MIHCSLYIINQSSFWDVNLETAWNSFYFLTKWTSSMFMENYCLPEDHKNGSLCRSTTITCIYLRRDGLYVLSEYRVSISIEELCSLLIIYRHKRAKEKRKLKKQLKVDSRLNPCLYVLIPNKIFFLVNSFLILWITELTTQIITSLRRKDSARII